VANYPNTVRKITLRLKETSTADNGKSVVKLTMLGTAHAPQTIIGPANSSTNTYSAANRSIAGSVHDPFVLGTATFVVCASGITANSVVEAAAFGNPGIIHRLAAPAGNYPHRDLVPPGGAGWHPARRLITAAIPALNHFPPKWARSFSFSQ
jgi:hypothetical protein